MNLCCLKCTSVLDRSTIEGIEVDHCPKCGGLWLDAGEIERLAKAPGDDVKHLQHVLERRVGPPPVPSDVTTACPACTGKMKEVPLGPIHIDVCTKCRGIFLDRGELDAALTVAKDDEATVGLVIASAATTVAAA